MNSLLINIALRNGLTNKILLFTSISLFSFSLSPFHPTPGALSVSLFHTLFHFMLSVNRVLSLYMLCIASQWRPPIHSRRPFVESAWIFHAYKVGEQSTDGHTAVPMLCICMRMGKNRRIVMWNEFTVPFNVVRVFVCSGAAEFSNLFPFITESPSALIESLKI